MSGRDGEGSRIIYREGDPSGGMSSGHKQTVPPSSDPGGSGRESTKLTKKGTGINGPVRINRKPGGTMQRTAIPADPIPSFLPKGPCDKGPTPRVRPATISGNEDLIRHSTPPEGKAVPGLEVSWGCERGEVRPKDLLIKVMR